MLDDGACYHGACTERRAVGSDPVTPVLAALPKCAYCSQPVEDAGMGVIIDGDQFHRSCWHVLVSQDLIRVSRSLSRRTRELLADARRRLDSPPNL
jgi:hypothetical protein